MTLNEFMYMTDLKLFFGVSINQKFYVHFQYNSYSLDEHEGCLIKGTSGRGDTVLQALEDYLNKVCGKDLWYCAGLKNEKKFKVPKEIKIHGIRV